MSVISGYPGSTVVLCSLEYFILYSYRWTFSKDKIL